MIDLDELERKASAATPGAAWFGADEIYYGETALSQSDAEFMAAFNPSVAQELIRRLRDADKDSKRIDWLADANNNIGNVQLPAECVLNNLHSLRAAIDEAMKI